MSHSQVSKPLDITIPASSLWAKLPAIGGVLAVIGLGATFAATPGEHGARAWFSYLWAFAALLSVCLGALAFVLIDHSVRAQWSGVIRQRHEPEHQGRQSAASHDFFPSGGSLAKACGSVRESRRSK